MERLTIALLASGAVVMIWHLGCLLAHLRTPGSVHYLRLLIADSDGCSPLHRGAPIHALLTMPTAGSSRTDGASRVSTSGPGEGGGPVHEREIPPQSTSLSSRLSQAGSAASAAPTTGRAEPASPLHTAVRETYLPPSDDHAVHLYETDAEIVSSVASYFESAITKGEAIVLVATGEHRRAIEQELGDRGYPLDDSRYVGLDAESTLASLLVAGEPDWTRFRGVVGVAVEALSSAFSGVTIYGEMVGLLWDRGQAVSAMRLEDFWNELAMELPFTLLCGYRTDDSADRSSFDGVCGLHSHVVATSVSTRS